MDTSRTLPNPASTYARARLRLGMSGVGSFVVLASALLLSGAPERWLPSSPQPLGVELGALACLVGVYALFQLPLDILGGWLLPRAYARKTSSFLETLAGWVRGASLQAALMIAFGILALNLSRWGGAGAAIAGSAFGMLLLVAIQAPLARLVGGLREAHVDTEALSATLTTQLGRPVRVEVWRADDEGFTGGWFGLPGFETLVLPERWLETFSRDELQAQLMHRAGAVASGGRTRGLLVALGFNLIGLGLGAALPGGGFDSVAALLITALGATLWSFLGLLVLPSLSRRAVLSADAYARRQGIRVAALSRAIRQLDRWQDDEPSRSATVETIFHPVPSVERRLELITGEARARGGAWHAARMMLFLSWASWGFLSRAVHCNAGRPQLWVALPAD